MYIADISADRDFAAATGTNGEVWSWGSDDNGPQVQVTGLTIVAQNRHGRRVQLRGPHRGVPAGVIAARPGGWRRSGTVRVAGVRGRRRGVSAGPDAALS